MTLVETLAVLSVIGIASAAAVSGLLPRPSDSVGSEAARLSQMLTLAADTSLANRQALALVWTGQAWGFRTRSGEGWTGPAPGPLAKDHPLPAGFGIRRDDGGVEPVHLLPDGLSSRAVLLVANGRDGRRVVFDGLSAAVTEGETR